MKKSKRKLTRNSDVRVFENKKARDIYINSDLALYYDNDGVYYLDELNHGANIEYSVCGSIEDIESYIIEVFGDDE